MKNKIISILLALSIIISTLFFTTIQCYAHSALLKVEYDVCAKEAYADDLDETWYFINSDYSSYHLGHEVITIKYYFEEKSMDGTYGWEDAVSPPISTDEANQIKEAYANSMKKWNNVYFYSYDSDGNVTKHKIINIIEGTATDHNLSIFPASGTTAFASTSVDGDSTIIEEDTTIAHKHYNKWKMQVYVYCFSSYNTSILNDVNVALERTGAHELGHVLGLRDADVICNSEQQHHQEILMGYGSTTMRTQDITYKDIAGVAITREFHTDEDHKWINYGNQNDGRYKLVCSICNGVKYEDNLNDYSYVNYRSCADNHTLGANNMFAVASYGNQDYYKCKYCRYVAPFSSIVTQNYTMEQDSSDFHKLTNTVSGLEYSFKEAHYEFSYERYNSLRHKTYCACGHYVAARSHVVSTVGFGFKICIYCGERIDSSSIIIPIPGVNSVSMRYITEAGSYVDANGIIYLVPSDLELVMAGELDVYALVENGGDLVTQ